MSQINPGNPMSNISLISKIKSWLKKYKLLAIIIAVSLIPFLIYIVLNLFSRLQLNYVKNISQKQQESNKQKQQEEYQSLLKKQRERNNRFQVEQKEEKRVALGDYNLYFIFVKPANLTESVITPLLNKLKEQDDQLYTSLLYVNKFYIQEAKKYGVSNFNLHINFYGVYNLVDLEKVGDIAYIWGKDPFATVRLQDSFSKLLEDHNINLDKNSLAVFLYFDDSFGESNPYANDRFYEHKKFRSFANEYQGTAYINVYNFSPTFAELVTEIATHETMHLFGATDKYEESTSVTRICSERGRGEPELKPAVPQKTTDLFCMYVEKADDKFTRGHFSQNNIVINKLTAKEIGWAK